MSLVFIGADWERRAGTPETRTRLGPGNWRLARGVRSDVTVVFDASEGRGLIALDAASGKQRWARPGASLRKVEADGELLVALSKESLEVLSLGSGAVLASQPLGAGDIEISSALRSENGFVYGGFDRSGGTHLIVANPPLHRLVSTVPSAHFPAAVIANARDSDCCGFDLHAIANLAWLERGGTALVVIGGGGEGPLSACQGACAAGVLDVQSGTLGPTQLLDEANGSSGLVALGGGRFVLEVDGRLSVLNYSPLPGVATGAAS
jgi:hypothetical protein